MPARPILLGVLACALTFGGLWSVRKCDLTPPCHPGADPVSGLEITCSTVKMIGPCPIDSLDVLASVAVGGTVAIWAYVRRREHARPG
jgi:hypothetical protein